MKSKTSNEDRSLGLDLSAVEAMGKENFESYVLGKFGPAIRKRVDEALLRKEEDDSDAEA